MRRNAGKMFDEMSVWIEKERQGIGNAKDEIDMSKSSSSKEHTGSEVLLQLDSRLLYLYGGVP